MTARLATTLAASLHACHAVADGPAPAVAARPPLQATDTPRVEGPQLKTVDGRDLWMQGVAIPSLEWNPRGENMLNHIWGQSAKEALAGKRFELRKTR